MTAAEKILQKALVASNLDSSQWNSIQAGLRDRAFFSSEVAKANILDAMRRMAADKASGVSASDARVAMRDFLRSIGHETPDDLKGTIKDLYAKSRLDVIIKTNVAQARGFIQHAEGMTPGALWAFPAQEFLRVEERREPRKDWAQRWQKAGGKIYGGRMIALKTDPVWTRLGPFGNPYPPFDWGSGMGVQDVSRKEAQELGLDVPDAPGAAHSGDGRSASGQFNSGMQAEIPMRHDSPEAQKLSDTFGDQVRFDGNTAHWQGELMRDVISGKLASAKLGTGFDGRKMSISHDIVKDHIIEHVGENEKDERNIPLEIGDFELIPAMWRKPDSHTVERGCDHLTLATFDGGILHLIVQRNGRGIKTFYKEKAPKGA